MIRLEFAILKFLLIGAGCVVGLFLLLWLVALTSYFIAFGVTAGSLAAHQRARQLASKANQPQT